MDWISVFSICVCTRTLTHTPSMYLDDKGLYCPANQTMGWLCKASQNEIGNDKDSHQPPNMPAVGWAARAASCSGFDLYVEVVGGCFKLYSDLHSNLHSFSLKISLMFSSFLLGTRFGCTLPGRACSPPLVSPSLSSGLPRCSRGHASWSEQNGNSEAKRNSQAGRRRIFKFLALDWLFSIHLRDVDQSSKFHVPIFFILYQLEESPYSSYRNYVLVVFT